MFASVLSNGRLLRAVPVGPTKMADFRTHYGLGNLNFDDLEYEQACNSEAVTSVLGALATTDWSATIVTQTPVGAVLRVAEGIDAIRNLARSGSMFQTEAERGAVILCGLSQIGGLLFCIFTIMVALLLCICAPIGSAFALYIYRILFSICDDPRTSRDRYIDDFINNRLESEEKNALLPN